MLLLTVMVSQMKKDESLIYLLIFSQFLLLCKSAVNSHTKTIKALCSVPQQLPSSSKLQAKLRKFPNELKKCFCLVCNWALFNMRLNVQAEFCMLRPPETWWECSCSVERSLLFYKQSITWLNQIIHFQQTTSERGGKLQ